MTIPPINFDKPLTATLANGDTLNFNLNMQVPGQRQIALALQAIADAHASQRLGSDIKKYDALNRSGGIDRSKLKNHGMTIGNY